MYHVQDLTEFIKKLDAFAVLYGCFDIYVTGTLLDAGGNVFPFDAPTKIDYATKDFVYLSIGNGPVQPMRPKTNIDVVGEREIRLEPTWQTAILG